MLRWPSGLVCFAADVAVTVRAWCWLLVGCWLVAGSWLVLRCTVQRSWQSYPLRPQNIFILGASWIKKVVINASIRVASHVQELQNKVTVGTGHLIGIVILI